VYEQQFTYTSATNCPTPIYPEKCTLTAKKQNKNFRYKFQGLLEQTSGEVVRTVYGFWNGIMLLIVSKQNDPPV